MQINTLTPTQYAESVFNEIHAVEPYVDGIHTLSYCEGNRYRRKSSHLLLAQSGKENGI